MKQNRGSEKELRDSIYECFASGKWVHMITLGEKDGMQRLDVRPGKGGGLIAWYTGPEEIKQGKCDLFITDINKLIEPMYSSRDIIDPFVASRFLDKYQMYHEDTLAQEFLSISVPFQSPFLAIEFCPS